MHEAIFARSAFAEGANVLKLALLPYSIGHEILLQRQGNPLVTMTEASFSELPTEVQRAKLFTAVSICERTWKQNHRPIQWPRLTVFFRRTCNTAAEIEKFRDYRFRGMAGFSTAKMPRISGAPFHYFGAPEEARLLLFAQRERLDMVCGVETVFDVPFAFALQLYLTDAEEKGNLWVQNHHDWSESERLKLFEQLHPENTLAVGDEAVQKSAEAWNKANPDCPVPLVLPTKQQEN